MTYTTGLARTLQSGMVRGKVRLRWTVLERGEIGTCSADWLPTAKRAGSSAKNLLHQTLHGKDTHDADIFVIALGMHDHERCGRRFGDSSAEFTLKNLQCIAEHLVAAGKRVLICRLPMPVLADGRGSLPSIQERQAQAMRHFQLLSSQVQPQLATQAESEDPLERQMMSCQQRNECIDVWLDSCQADYRRQVEAYQLQQEQHATRRTDQPPPVKPELQISLCVDFAMIACRQRQMRAWDGIHPSRSCYDRCTKISEENWLPAVVQAEWKVLRPLLQ